MSLGPQTILLVDDEPIVIRALGDLLRGAGYQVVAQESAEDALELAKTERFAVIISDYQMPQMFGMDFLNRVAGVQPNASRILITGVRSLDVVVSAINKGEIYRFITKPWVNAEMLATVHNGVQRYLLLEANEQLQADTSRLNRELADANRRLEDQVTTLKEQKQQLDDSREALRANFERSLELCYRIINTFDPLLGQQTKAAVEICGRMADSHYFDEQQRHALIVSAWLHDIGLMGLPRSAIRASHGELGKVPIDIRQLVRDHPIYGQTLASFVDNLQGVGETIRSHHERFDGKGYPDGLAGEAIPWPARCLAVVAHYVSSPCPPEEALDEVMALSGKAFEPNAVRLFLRCVETGRVPGQFREVMLDELRPGMQLAKGIYSPTGILLIPEGRELDATAIAKLRNHSQLTSLPQQLLVFR